MLFDFKAIFEEFFKELGIQRSKVMEIKGYRDSTAAIKELESTRKNFKQIMAHEIETKVLDINVDEIKNKLVSFGAQKVQETRLMVDWYQAKGEKEGSANWFLRIRSNSEGKHEVTWKAKSVAVGITKQQEEINFNITEPEKLADLFEKLGLEKYAHQEKNRTTFTYLDWQFDIDQYPGMPPFLEIEGKSEEHVKEAIALLDLESHKTWAKGERILIQEVYGLDWYTMKF